MITTSSALADAGCIIASLMRAPVNITGILKHRKHAYRHLKILFYLNSKVYDIQNTAVGQTKHLQEM